ncbi:MAG: hypothetical protein LBI67_01680 [Treponema sp.]|jgi:hypothetical protein|nr:hypothetical protein [Treponema sp.]
MSGYGLGKNSPVILSQSRQNFDALIQRHGQYVRWRTARKCTCVREETGQPDVHCEKCGMSGEIYGYQKFYDETLRLPARDNILELPAENANCEVLKVYDAYGNDFQAVKTGQFVEITSGPRPLNKNEIVELLIRDTVVRRLESAVLERVGNGYYRVPGVETPPSKLEGVYYQAEGDVIAAGRVENSAGETVGVTGYRQNMIQLDPAVPEAGTLTAYGIDFILPFKFVVLSQNLNKDDSLQLQLAKGEAVCTYPYMFNVGFGDVITVLSGTMPGKTLLPHAGDDADDVIFEYFVARIDKLETQAGEYREGVDFILAGTNRIHWTGEKRPEAGAFMSISYQYRPTYRVAKNIPQLRTSEDQRLPRKVILQSFAAFQESRRLNQNG